MISPNPATAEFATLFLNVAVKGLLLLALALIAIGCMRRNSAAARHLTLTLALGGLLILPLLSWRLPRLNVLPQWMGVHPSSSNGATAFVHSMWLERGPSLGNATKSNQTVTPASSGAPFQATSPVSLKAKSRLLSQWILTVWLLGACCAFAPTIAGLISLWYLRRGSKIIQSGPLFELLHRLRADANDRRKILLLTSTTRRMPMMWGMLHPRILLPHDSVDWPGERQRVVLLHELAHIQRHDFPTTLMTRLACALHWFNPLVWIAARHISHEQEQACDDIVLRQGTTPEDYAEEVLQFASGRRIAALESLGAVTMARPSSLEGRLLAILDRSRNHTSLTRTGFLTTVLLVVIAIIPVSMLRAAQTAESAVRSGSTATGLDRGLVAWWRGEGDGKDSAGNHDGAFPFGERYLPGLTGKAFNFLRSHSIEDQLQRVSIPDSPDFQLPETMTLEAWIYPLQYQGIVLIRGDDRGGYDAWQVDLMTDGHISFVFNAADNQGVGVSAPIQLNQWQHITAVFDRGTMNLYVNGILAAQKQTDLRPITALDKEADPALGIGNAGGKYYSMPFNGVIDEVRIYNRALTEAEIDERMRK